jgi:lysyl-tRNA synthetase class 2
LSQPTNLTASDMPASSPWWHPERHADRQPFLLGRARIKSAIRAWFEAQGFIEVDTTCLQASPGNETHLQAFETELIGPALERRALYLHTSPELAMKKLLAAGEEKIFTFAPVFRNRERGALHHPEFTLLEWYRARASYEDVMKDAAALIKLAAETVENRFFSFRGRTSNPRAEPEILTVAEAMSRYAGVDLLSTITPHGNDRDRLATMLDAQGVTAHADDTWSDLFAKALTALVEPRLGNGRPTLLTEYPRSEAALARAKDGDPRVAERFELYCCGVEIANGFGELTDAAEQRRRLETQMNEKERIYGDRYPLDEDFLQALSYMPPASGCALGFDRLVMLATGAERIEQVIWTPLPDD